MHGSHEGIAGTERSRGSAPDGASEHVAVKFACLSWFALFRLTVVRCFRLLLFC